MIINTNLPAMSALRNLNAAQGAVSNSMQKLSSGKRINSAADDAAGLAITQTMESQIEGLNQASRNSQDAISLMQTGEGALNETQSILQRMRDLSVEASSDTYTANDRSEIQKEVDQLKQEVDQIGNTTTFNGKNLLDGSAAALTSSDNKNTQVFVRGSLTVGSGSYKLSVTATAGKSEIQKSNVFKISSGEVINSLNVAANSGVNSVDAKNLQYGDYTVDTTVANAAGGSDDSAATEGAFYTQATASAPTNAFNGGAVTEHAATETKNMSILAQVTGISGTNVTYQMSWHSLDHDGTSADGSQAVTLDLSAASSFTLNGVKFDVAKPASGTAGNLNVGDKEVITALGDSKTAGTNDTATIKVGTTTVANVIVDTGVLNNKTTDFKAFSLDTTSGQSYDGDIAMNIGGLTPPGAGHTVSFTAADGTGQLASLNTQLSNVDKFTDANGKFLLEQPQSLTLIEGDGKQTSVQLYASDTMQNVVDKLNSAIGTGLGQKDLLSSAADANKFVSFVSTPSSTGGPESTQGTLVIRSAMAGQAGQINVVGDENLISALGLSDEQQATESKFNVSVTDANNPSNIIASNVSIQGNTLVGVVDQNVDVKFASNANINSAYDSTSKQFNLTSGTNAYTTTVNLVSNSQTFQIGANQAQNMTAAIGDMRSAALGVDNVLVTDQKSAANAITVIDSAIARVSAQRSQLGALQNRLTHTINNLGVAGQNLTASQSNIQDVDMAQEMTTYAKEGILTTSANSMLAQANNKNTQLIQQLLQG